MFFEGKWTLMETYEKHINPSIFLHVWIIFLLTPPSGARRGYTKSLLVLEDHLLGQMIRKNQFMVGSDHKSKTLFGTPRQKVGGAK